MNEWKIEYEKKESSRIELTKSNEQTDKKNCEWSNKYGEKNLKINKTSSHKSKNVDIIISFENICAQCYVVGKIAKIPACKWAERKKQCTSVS